MWTFLTFIGEQKAAKMAKQRSNVRSHDGEEEGGNRCGEKRDTRGQNSVIRARAVTKQGHAQRFGSCGLDATHLLSDLLSAVPRLHNWPLCSAGAGKENPYPCND